MTETAGTVTWGPRWAAVGSVDGSVDGADGQRGANGLRKVVRVQDGTAARPGGTWRDFDRVVAQWARAVGYRLGSPRLVLAGMGPEQVQAWVRERTRRRVEVLLAADRKKAQHELAALVSPADVLAYRQQEGLSQRDLAARVGVSRGAVAECELGNRPGLDVLAWVAAQTGLAAGR